MFKGEAMFGRKPQPDPRDVRQPPPPQASAPPPAPRAAARPETTAAAPAATPQPPRAGEAKGSRLIVGPDIKLKGAEITDCDTLVVEGRVEAAMDSRVMQIAEHGVFSGTAGIDIAEIHGRFEGDLIARKQLLIHTTGKVTGKIRYGKLTIEEGGELSGDIGALHAADMARRDPAVAAKPAAG